MGCYAIRHFDDGLVGARYLSYTPARLLLFDYPTELYPVSLGNPPSDCQLIYFETEGDCEAWLMANIDKPTYDGGTVGDGYTAWIE